MRKRQSLFQLITLASLTWVGMQSALAQHCNATQDYVDLNNGTILDLGSGLQWQLCRVGQTWKDGTCTGTRRQVGFVELSAVANQNLFLGLSDWRVPSRNDYVSIGASEPRLEQRWPLTTKHCRGINWTEASDRENPRDVPEWTSTSPYAVTAWNDPDKPMVAGVNSLSANFVRLVRMAPYFGFNSGEALQNATATLHQHLPSTTLWRTSYQPQGVERVFGDRRRLILPVLALLYEDEMRGIEASIPPVFSESQPVADTPRLTKDEFETTAQFDHRQRATLDAVQSKHAKDLAEFDRRRNNINLERDTAIAAMRLEREDPSRIKARVERLLPRAIAAVFGNPELREITYDADRQVFSALVVGSKGGFQQSVQVSAPLKEAPRLKQELLNGKIAPLLFVQVPNLDASWVLEENASLRALRFSKANDSIQDLLELIDEYPKSGEAALAKKRIPELQRQAYLAAERADKSSAYQSFVSNFAGTDTQGLLPKAKQKMALAERREAEERRREEQRAREAQLQWERDRPAREAREQAQNLCRAQVNTCIASCPKQWSDISKSYIDIPDYSCKSRCESVSCN